MKLQVLNVTGVILFLLAGSFLSAEPAQLEFKEVGGIPFIYLQGGTFSLGSFSGESFDGESPAHRVTVAGFWMGQGEVTQAQWNTVMGTNLSSFRFNTNLPVERVNWKEAKEFCSRFSARHHVRIRLPTEAEWEYACRAGSGTQYYWGDRPDPNFQWSSRNASGMTHTGGMKFPNAWKLYDMSGNVMEWCEDWYRDDFYQYSPADNPVCTNSSSRQKSARGGGWIHTDTYGRSAKRTGLAVSERNNALGFRVVMEEK